MGHGYVSTCFQPEMLMPEFNPDCKSGPQGKPQSQAHPPMLGSLQKMISNHISSMFQHTLNRSYNRSKSVYFRCSFVSFNVELKSDDEMKTCDLKLNSSVVRQSKSLYQHESISYCYCFWSHLSKKCKVLCEQYKETLLGLTLVCSKLAFSL